MSEAELCPGTVSPLGIGTVPHEDLAQYAGLQFLQCLIDGHYPAPQHLRA